MGAYRSNIPEVISRMGGIEAKINRKVAALVRRLILQIDISVHQKTPVWSGLAIRNMIWTKGRPNTTEYPEIKIGDVTDESRRPANAAAAQRTRDAELAKVGKKPFGVWYLSNASHHIFELEAGNLPSPDRSRVPPGGMFGLTYAQLRAGMGA